MAEATYHVSANVSAAGANKRHLCLFNASGSGKTLKLYRLQVTGAPNAAVTGLVITLSAMRITAAPTGGTGATINKARTATVAVPAQVTAMLAATGGATEEPSAFAAGIVSGEETSSAAGSDLYDFRLNGTEPMTFVAGEGFVVKQGALASAGAITVVATFTLV